MSDKKYTLNFGGLGWIFWLALIVLCWGEPDVLDGIIKRVNNFEQVKGNCP